VAQRWEQESDRAEIGSTQPRRLGAVRISSGLKFERTAERPGMAPLQEPREGVASRSDSSTSPHQRALAAAKRAIPLIDRAIRDFEPDLDAVLRPDVVDLIESYGILAGWVPEELRAKADAVIAAWESARPRSERPAVRAKVGRNEPCPPSRRLIPVDRRADDAAGSRRARPPAATD
jgi:hypothetical protein